MKKFLVFIIWMMLFVTVIDFCLDMISSTSDAKCVIGAIGIVAAMALSYKTKCLTAIKIKKHEK